jgi:hypothetical protein
MTTGSRAWCVTMKTGVWYGGSSPHQPSQGCLPRAVPPPNMFLPITTAPMFSSAPSTTVLTR